MTKKISGGNSSKGENGGLNKEIADLYEKVRELEETLSAIRSGEVDAIVVEKGDARQVYTLEGADHPYRALVENIREGALTLSRTGMILYTNTRFADMVKQIPEKVVGTSIFDYVCKEHHKEMEEALQAITKQSCRRRVRIRQGKGSLPVLISMNPLSAEEATKISVIVTDRRKDEDQIQMQARMLDAVGDAVIAADINNKIIYWNDAATRTYGWEPEEALGRDLFEVTTPEISKKVVQGIAAQLKKGSNWTGRYTVRHRDGHEFPVHANDAPVFDDEGKFIAIIGASHDISEQTLIEEALRESEEKYRNLVKYAPAAIYEMDLQGTKFLSVNEVMCNILGYTREELFSIMPGDLLDPESRSLFKERISKKLAGEKINEPVEYRIQRKDGEWIDTAVSVGSFTYSNENPSRVVVIGYDITERKKMEEELKRKHNDLNAAFEEITSTQNELRKNIDELTNREKQLNEALAEKEVLLSEIHHRVKNNLAAFISLLSLEGSYDVSPAGQMLKKDLQNRARTMALIHETLYRTRKFSDVDMNVYLNTLVEQIVNSYRTDQTLKTSVEAHGVTLDLVRATPIGLIVNELVTNSLKYAFPKKPTLAGMDRKEPCTIGIQISADDGNYLMKVSDNGIGLPVGWDIQETQTLGLKLVNFLARHQLRAKIEINRDKGTEFIFRFRKSSKMDTKDYTLVS
jgi:PAS domain S-box-containing protein